MLDMKSTGHALVRLSLLVVVCLAPIAGCKTLSLGKDKSAAIEVEDPESVADAAVPINGKPNVAARSMAHAGSAYIDPYMTANNAESTPDSPPQTLPGSQEPAASIGGLATQPTGIKAYQSSIFSSGIASAHEAPPRGQDGAVLPPSAYGPAPGVNATLYSVYGKGDAVTGSLPPSIE